MRIRRSILQAPGRPRQGDVLAVLVRRLLVAAVVLLVLLGTAGDAAMGVAKGKDDCRVVKIIDGDTVTLWCGAGVERARLTGFDTPEIFSPECLSERFLGIRALYALRGDVWRAGAIRVRTGGRDRYGRLLAEMLVDGVPVGDGLVKRGLARPYFGGRREGWCA